MFILRSEIQSVSPVWAASMLHKEGRQCGQVISPGEAEVREGWGVVQGVAFRRFPDLGAARVGGKNLWLGLKPPASAAPRGLPSLLGRTETHLCPCC